MAEIIILIVALAGISSRARQRGLSGTKYLAVAGLGYLFFFAAGSSGPVFVLRWLWVAGVFAMVEWIHGDPTIGESWQRPECRMYNEPGDAACLCGHQHPEAQNAAEA
ncbi:MAG: hypothetical protein MPN21_10975 [Thermoanaerobaculia bacterium]|nr:hypothetical protein [Thermoanaerobaculia bacterium]